MFSQVSSKFLSVQPALFFFIIARKFAHVMAECNVLIAIACKLINIICVLVGWQIVPTSDRISLLPKNLKSLLTFLLSPPPSLPLPQKGG